MIKIVLTLVALALFSGCATPIPSNFSTQPNAVKLKNEKNYSGSNVWSGTHIYSAGSVELGYQTERDEPNQIEIDPGKTSLKVWYLAKRDDAGNVLYQTDLTELRANLEPDGEYQIRCECTDKTAVFSVYDLQLNQVVTRSGEVPIYAKEAPPLPPDNEPSVLTSLLSAFIEIAIIESIDSHHYSHHSHKPLSEIPKRAFK